MTRRARNLIALALAVFGALVAATYEPFGGGGRPMQILDPIQSGYETGIRASGIAKEDLSRFKKDEHLARYLAVRDGVPKEMRDVWCQAFVHGLRDARRMQGVQDYAFGK